MLTERIDAIGIGVSAILLVLVLELVRRRRLTEEYSYLWIAGALGVFALSVRRDLLDRSARWLGVYYPPSLLLLVLLVVVFIGALSITVVLSRHRRQIERLMEDSAILAAELRELRGAGVPPPAVEHEAYRIRATEPAQPVSRTAAASREPGL